MVAYNFQPQFETPILAGRKKQTVRDLGKPNRRHASDGDTLQIYTGMRTKNCRLLGLAVCVSALPVTVDREECRITISGAVFEAREDLDTFAQADGFDDWDAFLEWLIANKRPPLWSAVVITWRDFVPANLTKQGGLHVDN